MHYRLSLCKLPTIDHRYLSPIAHTFIVYLLPTTTIVWTHVITLSPSKVYHYTSLVSNIICTLKFIKFVFVDLAIQRKQILSIFVYSQYLYIKLTDSIKIQHYNPEYPPEHSPCVIFYHRRVTSS